MKRIKIQPSEASEWMKEGYEIECFAIVEPVKASRRDNHSGRIKAFRSPVITLKTKLTLSLEGREPKAGKMGAAWPLLKKELWADKVTAQYTRSDIEASLSSHGYTDRSGIAYMVNRLKCLRVVQA